MGFTKRSTTSQDGDDFSLDKREFVVVTRVYEKRGLVELVWSGLTGLFPIEDVEILKKDDHKGQDRSPVVEDSPGLFNKMKEGDNVMSYNKPEARFRESESMSANTVNQLSSGYNAPVPRFGGLNTGEIISPSTPSSTPSKMMKRQMKRIQEGYSDQKESRNDA